MPLQPQGSKPPLFLVHGWGGDVYGFMALAKLMDADRPIYGIQAVGLDGKVPRHTSVEEMAAYYVKEIRSFQPEGPYFLAAYSLGGLIAFEVAQQLHRLDQRVAFLGLMDSDPIDGLPWSAYAPYLVERCTLHFRRWWAMPNHDRLDYLGRRWATLRTRTAKNRSKPPPRDSQTTQVAGFDDYYHSLTAAYRLQPYAGSIDVFASDETESHGGTSWRHLVSGSVSLHRVPGTHFEIIKPAYVPKLAEVLRAALNQAR